MSTFSDFPLLPSLQKSLAEMDLVKPTEVQENVIPLLLAKQSVVGIAQTGSGKTLAYALPLLHRLKTLENEGNPVTEPSAPRAIVMVPTRELGEQISKVFKTLTHDTRLRVRPALGGMAMEQSRRNVSSAFEILLATPGRLAQLVEKEAVSLTDVRILIFDEADQMLDEGFLPESARIVESCPSWLQLGLFSATVSTPVQQLIESLFTGAKVFKGTGSGKVVATLTTRNIQVVDGKRMPYLEKVLAEKSKGATILFTNTREQCDKLAKELGAKGYAHAVYRGEMTKNERRAALQSFRQGHTKILISTDLASRGLDIESVDRVINYHMPKQMENYLHRVGRTARAGRPGLVINLITERDAHLIARLEGKVSMTTESNDTPLMPAPAKQQVRSRPARSAAPATQSRSSSSAAGKPRSPARPGASRPSSGRSVGKRAGPAKKK